MNVRNIYHKSVLLMTAAVALCSCNMMKEDLSDCPTGLYVNFVYDYNIQRADMFKDHVGGLTLYVFDESDRIAAQRMVSGSELTRYGYNIHFTESELAPDHQYRLLAVAMQKDWNYASSTAGYKTSIGDNRQSLKVTLAHQQGAPYGSVSNAAPLDTLWHTLTVLKADGENLPGTTKYHLDLNGKPTSNGTDLISVVRGEPSYATVSLIRDTKHLNISLRELDSNDIVTGLSHEDYDVFIVDANTELDYQNNLITPTDSVIYRPYASWTTTYDGGGLIGEQQAAHYDLMFNRLKYSTTISENAVLCIRKRSTGQDIAVLNLPYVLCEGRMAFENQNYSPQEYLDREYDYRLEFFLKGDKWMYIAVCVDILPWVHRIQNVELE